MDRLDVITPAPERTATSKSGRYRQSLAVLTSSLLVALVNLVPVLKPPPAWAVSSSTIVVGNEPQAVAVDPTTHTIYVANTSSNSVSVINGVLNTVIATIPVGSNPRALAVNPATKTVYVANTYSNNVSVIDGATNSVTHVIGVGTNPHGVGIDTSTNTIYVSNWSSLSNSVSVINGATNAVTSTIAVGSAPEGVAVDSTLHKVYVANGFSNTVSVINGATNAVTSTIAVGSAPEGVAVNETTRKVYVANWTSNSVSVIDETTEAVTTVAVGTHPRRVAVNPDVDTIYVTNEGNWSVSIIDGASNTVTHTIGVGASPNGVATDPTTNTTYVTNSGSNTVTVISPGIVTVTVSGTQAYGGAAAFTQTNDAPSGVTLSGSLTCTTVDGGTAISATLPLGSHTVDGSSCTGLSPSDGTYVVRYVGASGGFVVSLATTINVGNTPRGVAIDPGAGRVYVTNKFSNSVSVIDETTRTVVANIPVGSYPMGVAVNPDTHLIYVANNFSSSVSVIDGSTNAVVQTIDVNRPVEWVAVNPTTDTIYVTAPQLGAAAVLVIDGSTNAVTHSIPVGAYPEGVAINPITNTVYVANSGDGTVSVINGGANLVTDTFYVGGVGPGLAVDPVTNTVYVANFTGAAVTVIDGATNQFVERILGGTAPIGVAVNPSIGTVYVTNNYISANSVSVINGATNAIVHTIGVGRQPYGVAVNPITDTAYVANSYDGTVSVISWTKAMITVTVSGTQTFGGAPTFTQTNDAPAGVTLWGNLRCGNITSGTAISPFIAAGAHSVAGSSCGGLTPSDPTSYTLRYVGAPNGFVVSPATIDVGTVAVGTYPQGVAVDPGTGLVYAANTDDNTVSVFAEGSNEIATIAVGRFPGAVAVDPDTRTVWVTNYGDNTVSQFAEGSTVVTLPAIAVGAGPIAVAVDPGTHAVYVANFSSNSVSVIKGGAVTSIAVGTGPVAVAVDPITHSVYVVNRGAGTVSVIDANVVTRTIAVGSSPDAVAVDPDARIVYVNVPNVGVKVIDAGTRTVTRTFTLDTPDAGAMAVNPLTRTIYLVNSWHNTVTLIDGVHGTVASTVPVGRNPAQVAVDPNTNTAYVTNRDDRSVSVISWVTRTTINVTVSGSQAYGGSPTFTQTNDAPAGVTLSGTLSCATVDSGTAISPSLPAGNHTVVGSSCTGLTASNGATIDYSGGAFIVSPAPLTITASSPSMTYGGPVPAITPSYAAFVNGDTPASLATPPTCSTTATAGSPVGSYPSNCSGAADPDYIISYVTGSVTVGPAVLTITASSHSVTYGDPVPAITPSYAGFVDGDTAASLATQPICTTGYTQGASAGSYPSTCSGAADTDYTIGYVAGSVTVGPAALTITASSPSMTYGGPVPAITPSYSGFVNGDTAASLATPPTCSTTATAGSPVGSYPSTCSGAADPDYTIGYVAGSVTVGPAVLTITASSHSVTYGDPVPAITPSYAGFVDGDTAASLATQPICTTGYTQGASAGSYPSTCSGAADTDYTIGYVAGSVTVGPAALTITASSSSVTYGGPLPAITPSYSGFVNGDSPASLATPPSCTTSYTQGASAGSYPSTCSGTADPDYTIGYVAGSVTVGPAALTITASSPSMTYGGPVPAITPSFAGFVNGDNAASLATPPTCSTTATAGSPVGSYPSNCSGAADPDYTISYVAGSVTVGPAALIITASSPSVTYGDPVPAITPSYSGFVNGDNAASLATPPICTTSYTQGASAGSYPSTCAGAADPDYTIGYVAGSVTVGRARLTITANDQTVNYSDALPGLTVSYSGFVLGQNQSVLSGSLSCTPSVTVTAGKVLSPAGAYPIACSGLGSANYAIEFKPGMLTVTPEGTVVRLAQNNPHAVQSATSGTNKGKAPAMTFSARVTEVADGSYGDIAKAKPVTFTLNPVGSGSTISCPGSVTQLQPATATTPGFELVSCTVPAGTPVNVYEVTVTVGGNNYWGSDDSVLTVYDPSAGGSNAAGTVTNPNTGASDDFSYSASYNKNGGVQGKFLYIARDGLGNLVHVLKGNVMSTMAINGSTVQVTGKATLDGVGNYTYVFTGIDRSNPNSASIPDEYGQRITGPSGTTVSSLTYNSVVVKTTGNVFVGK